MEGPVKEYTRKPRGNTGKKTSKTAKEAVTVDKAAATKSSNQKKSEKRKRAAGSDHVPGSTRSGRKAKQSVKAGQAGSAAAGEEPKIVIYDELQEAALSSIPRSKTKKKSKKRPANL